MENNHAPLCFSKRWDSDNRNLSSDRIRPKILWLKECRSLPLTFETFHAILWGRQNGFVTDYGSNLKFPWCVLCDVLGWNSFQIFQCRCTRSLHLSIQRISMQKEQFNLIFKRHMWHPQHTAVLVNWELLEHRCYTTYLLFCEVVGNNGRKPFARQWHASTSIWGNFQVKDFVSCWVLSWS